MIDIIVIDIVIVDIENTNTSPIQSRTNTTQITAVETSSKSALETTTFATRSKRPTISSSTNSSSKTLWPS